MADYFRDYCNQCQQLRKLYKLGTGWYCQKCLNSEGIEGHDYRDSAEFIEYAATIEAIVHNVGTPPCSLHTDEASDVGASEGITIRALHEILDFRARREWTLDALDSLKSVEAVGTIVTRYRKAAKCKAPQYRHRWTGDSFSWIFAGRSGQEREASFTNSAR